LKLNWRKEMAKYTITCNCGHEKIFNIVGPVRTRDDRAAWLASQPCPSCRWAAEQEAKKAEEEAQKAAAAQKRITKSVIMQAAWRYAKAAVKKFGGKASDYIAETMRQAWADAKVYVAQGSATKAW
jgi:hypothetical protein